MDPIVVQWDRCVPNEKIFVVSLQIRVYLNDLVVVWVFMVYDQGISHFDEIKGLLNGVSLVVSDVHHLILGDWTEGFVRAVEFQVFLFIDKHPIWGRRKLCNCYFLPSVIVHYFYIFSSTVYDLNI